MWKLKKINLLKNLERKMRLQEELVHVDSDEFAVNHRAGHGVLHVHSIASGVLASGFDEEALVVALVDDAVDEVGLPFSLGETEAGLLEDGEFVLDRLKNQINFLYFS